VHRWLSALFGQFPLQLWPPPPLQTDRLSEHQRSQESVRAHLPRDSAPYVDVDQSAYDMLMGVVGRQRGGLHRAARGYDAEVEDHWTYVDMMDKQRTDAVDTVSRARSYSKVQSSRRI